MLYPMLPAHYQEIILWYHFNGWPMLVTRNQLHEMHTNNTTSCTHHVHQSTCITSGWFHGGVFNHGWMKQTVDQLIKFKINLIILNVKTILHTIWENINTNGLIFFSCPQMTLNIFIYNLLKLKWINCNQK